MADMSLVEIFVLLPEDIQAALEAELEASSIRGDVTRESVMRATREITENLRYHPSATHEVRELLDRVPQAVVDTLF